MLRRATSPRKRCFTLVEVMVALTVFALTMTGSLATVGSLWHMISKSQERLYVTRILESRLEEVRDLTFDELTSLPAETSFTVHPALTILGAAVNPDIVDPDYVIELTDATGTIYIDSMGTDYRKITVAISWKSGAKGVAMTMATTTYVTRGGVNRQ